MSWSKILPIFMLVGCLTFMAICALGCGNSDRDWVEAEAVATAYLKAVSSGEYGVAYDLHDSAFPVWNKPAGKEEFVQSMKGIAKQWPKVFEFTWELQRIDGMPRSRIYNFKVLLTWPGGSPVIPENAMQTKQGLALPVIGPEMLLGTNQDGGKWKVNIFGEHRPPLKLFPEDSAKARETGEDTAPAKLND